MDGETLQALLLDLGFSQFLHLQLIDISESNLIYHGLGQEVCQVFRQLDDIQLEVLDKYITLPIDDVRHIE